MSEADSKYSESLVSQETLDELMKEAEDKPQLSSDAGDETADLDLVSPEDIEKLLDTTTVGPSDDEEESELDLISQDDIDSLVSGEELSGASSSDSGDSDDSLISQDDIDALLGGADSSDSSVGEETSDDSLISQDDIDALLSGDDSLAEADEDDSVQVVSDESDDSDASLISQDDIDSLLNDVGSSEDTAEEQLVTQDDIENLLANDDAPEKPEAAVDTGEKLVSQEDIDKLLNADIEDDIEESYEALEAVADQVILEKSDEDQTEEERKSLKKWLTNKIVIGCSIAALVLVVTGIGFVVFSGGSDTEIVEIEVAEETQDAIISALDEEILEPQDLKEDVFVIVELKDFVVPAPLAMKDISYISLDLSLEIVDVTSDPIKGYEPFFRNIIYEVLNKALELQSESRVIEADLIRMIKKALNGALSEGSINKVSFMEFNIT